jgi:hypothetical protein
MSLRNLIERWMLLSKDGPNTCPQMCQTARERKEVGVTSVKRIERGAASLERCDYCALAEGNSRLEEKGLSELRRRQIEQMAYLTRTRSSCRPQLLCQILNELQLRKHPLLCHSFCSHSCTCKPTLRANADVFHRLLPRPALTPRNNFCSL